MAVKDDENGASARAFLEAALNALPFQVTHVLTGSRRLIQRRGLREALTRARSSSNARHGHTRRARTGWRSASTAGSSARCSDINVDGHGDLERLLDGFSSAYNARRQRVLGGRSPEEVVRERPGAKNADSTTTPIGQKTMLAPCPRTWWKTITTSRNDSFPRGALQAMAAGRLAILPPGFRAVLGDGPVYREPDQVADTIRYLQPEERFYRATSRSRTPPCRSGSGPGA